MTEEVSGGVLCADLHLGVLQLQGGDDGESMVDLESLVDVMTRIELDVAYFSVKLANLDLYLTNLWLRENNLGASSLENDGFSPADIQEAIVLLDLSCSYVGSEVEELGCFLDHLQEEILKAGLTIPSLEEEEFSTAMQEKLQGSESSLKLSSLVRENKILMEELRRAKKNGSEAKFHGKEGDEKGFFLSMDRSENTPTVEASAEELRAQRPPSFGRFGLLFQTQITNFPWSLYCQLISRERSHFSSICFSDPPAIGSTKIAKLYAPFACFFCPYCCVIVMGIPFPLLVVLVFLQIDLLIWC